MARIPEEEVRRLARLARIELEDEEVARLAPQLADVLAHVERMNRVDTSNVEATSHGLQQAGGLRQDEPRSSLTLEESLGNAGSTARGRCPGRVRPAQRRLPCRIA
jgi:aspartyl-tRNA(Asn)/glutamyl-tRNA(Gln) amidotransferase subunit C